MRTIENFPTDLSVAKPVAVVRVGGVVLGNVGEVTVTRGAGTAGLPSALVDGGTSRASAEFTVLPAAGKRSVWPSGTPERGTSVTIDTGYEGATARRFTGVVDYCEGGVGEAATVHCVDLSDRLRRPASFDPLLHIHPNYVASNPRNGLCVGLMSTHFVAESARRSGFYPGPAPMDWSTLTLFAPLNGTAWAYTGRTDKANRFDGSAETDRVPTPWYLTDPWGSGAQSLHARYAPTNVEFPTSGYTSRPQAGKPLKILFMVGEGRATQSQYTRVVANWPGGAWVNARIHPTNSFVEVSLSNGRTIPAIAAGTGSVVQVTIDVGGAVTVETAGQSQTSTGTLPAGMASTNVDNVEVRVPEGGRAIAYLQMWNSTQQGMVSFTPTALIDGRSASTGLRASPTINGQRYLDLVDEIAAAEVSAVWLDEDGRLVLKHRTTLEAQPVARTMTATRDLAPYRWREEWGAQRSAVRVGWKKTSTQVSFGYPTITVYQGSGDTRLAADGASEELVHPPSGEEWIWVSLPLLGRNATDDGDLPGFPLGFDAGVHSWVIGTYDTPSGAEQYETTGVSCRQIDPRTFLFENASIARDVTLRVPEEPTFGQRVKPRWRGEKTPILRARGKSVMVDQTATVTGGATGAPVLEHDAGWLAQNEARATGLASLLMARCMSPIIAIPSVSILPDPRVQQYDRLTLRDDIDAEAQWDVLVTGYREHLRPAEGVYEQSLDIQVLSMTDRDVITYEMVDQSWSGNTYNQVETENPSTTYQQFENDPWKG